MENTKFEDESQFGIGKNIKIMNRFDPPLI